MSRLVRLKPLLEVVRKLMRPDGELWAAREYVGLPGWEMDEADWLCADGLYRSCPACRRHHEIHG